MIGGFAGLMKTALLMCGGRGVLSPRGCRKVEFGLSMPAALYSWSNPKM